MSQATPSTTASTPAPAAERDKQVEPLELFFDLVFVFALTQVTSRLAADPSGLGLLRGCSCWRRSGGRGRRTPG